MNKQICCHCSGNGKCFICNGTGLYGTGTICGKCNGTGTCNVCRGTGKIEINFNR